MSGAPVTPSDISSLYLWLEADVGLTVSGSNVTGWSDQSGNGRDITTISGTAPTKNSNLSNGKPSVTFTAANSTYLKTAAFGSALSQPYTICMVGRHTGSTTVQYYADGQSSTHRATFVFNSSTQVENFSGTALDTTTTNGTSAAIWMWNCVFNGNSSVARIRNGTQSTTLATASGNANTNSLDGVTLGARFGLSNFLDGDICEYIIYSKSLSATEVAQIESYFENKYKIKANLISSVMSAQATMSPALMRIVNAVTTMSAEGDFTDALTFLRSINDVMSGQGTLSPTLGHILQVADVMSAQAVLLPLLGHIRTVFDNMFGQGFMVPLLGHLDPVSQNASGQGDLIAPLTFLRNCSANLSGKGDMTAPLTFFRSPSVEMDGTGSFLAPLKRTVFPAAEFDGQGTLTPGLAARNQLLDHMNSHGSMTANLLKTVSNVCTMGGSAEVTADLTRVNNHTLHAFAEGTLLPNLTKIKHLNTVMLGKSGMTETLQERGPERTLRFPVDEEDFPR